MTEELSCNFDSTFNRVLMNLGDVRWRMCVGAERNYDIIDIVYLVFGDEISMFFRKCTRILLYWWCGCNLINHSKLYICKLNCGKMKLLSQMWEGSEKRTMQTFSSDDDIVTFWIFYPSNVWSKSLLIVSGCKFCETWLSIFNGFKYYFPNIFVCALCT